ncbi:MULTISPECIES: hypothetical protein [unclassified Microcoleus]|uniref:hypothetical protein n=1 Tax=unclassified Microcoleus TaxID=2642155 RepID=UPI002FD603DD
MTQELLEKMENQTNRWHRSAVILHSIAVTLGVTSVLSSIIVATFIDELGSFRTKVFAGLSATSVAILETTGVGRKGNGFRQAQRHLKAETIRFREGESSVKALTQAFIEAELMIGDLVIKMPSTSDLEQK